MKSRITIYIFFLFTFFSYSLNAQVVVLLNSESKDTTLNVLSGASTSASTNFKADKSVSSYYHTLKTISESTSSSFFPASDDARKTYRDLNKVAADSKSNFLHSETNTVFYYTIGEFERTQIIAYPKDPGRITAIYNNQKGKSSFVVNLTPTKEGTEGRLRNEYLKEIKKLSKEEETNFLPKPTVVKFNGTHYICNGVQGSYTNGKKHSISQVTVFECGAWLMDVNLKSSDMDSVRFSQLDEGLILRFNPARLTSLSPLNLKSNVGFVGEAMKDSVLTSAMVNSAFKKMDWASDNVSIKERHSGFPDIYLAMHIASLTEYLRIQSKKKNLSKSPKAKQFFDDLNAIYNAGFLPEFIMEEYDHVMIVPANINLNFEAFSQWKLGRELSLNLKEKKYTITYRNLPY